MVFQRKDLTVRNREDKDGLERRSKARLVSDNFFAFVHAAISLVVVSLAAITTKKPG